MHAQSTVAIIMQAQIFQALQNGHNEQALTLAQAYLNNNPDDVEAYVLLAMAYRNSDDVGNALATIDKAIALAPEESNLHFLRAGYLLHTADVEEATQALAKSVELNPNQLGVYIMQGELALTRNDLDQAQHQLTLARKLDREHPHVLMLEGNLALRRGQLEEALMALSRAAEKAPNDLRILYSLGLVYMAKEHLAFAEQAFRRVSTAMPDALSIRGFLIEAIRRQNRPDDALKELEPLLQTNPTPIMQRLAGELNLQMNKAEDSLQHFESALTAEPRDPASWQIYLQAAHYFNQPQRAEDFIEQALHTLPDNNRAWQARLALENDDQAKALVVINRWIDAMPESIAALEAKLALLGDRNRHEKAEEIVERLLTLAPDHYWATIYRIEHLTSVNPEEAIRFIDQLLEKGVSANAEQELMVRKGYALDRAQRYSEALALWDTIRKQTLEQGLPLPKPTRSESNWTQHAEQMAINTVFIAGLPGALSERTTQLISESTPEFRSDRYSERTPNDLLQNFYIANRLAEGKVSHQDVYDSWLAELSNRGIEHAQIIDWLLWWDNALIPVFKEHFQDAHLIVLLRDPRDMLLDWIAFGAPIRFQYCTADAMAAWLTLYLEHIAILQETNAIAHTIIRVDELHRTPAQLARHLNEAAGLDIPQPHEKFYQTPRFEQDHWRAYAKELGNAFDTLTPIAIKLGYSA